MIWLIGNKGMLGTEVEALLTQKELPYLASDQEVDITNIETLKEFAADKPITWIINCAAYTAVDKAEDEPDLAFKLNADGPCNIAEIAKTKEAKLIHISTDYVFDGTKEGAYLETDIPNPLGVYGKSKYQGEINIQKTLKEYFILRSAWLYGKNGRNFVLTMLRLFNERKEVRVVNDQWGSPTYAVDLAGALIKIVCDNSENYGIYNVANEGKISWYDFAVMIHKIANEKRLLDTQAAVVPIDTDGYVAKAKRPKNSCLSKDKIREALGIEIRDWRAALRDFFKDMASNQRSSA
jgi:dTDP-4-dehydrorhamnose reductase